MISCEREKWVSNDGGLRDRINLSVYGSPVLLVAIVNGDHIDSGEFRRFVSVLEFYVYFNSSCNRSWSSGIWTTRPTIARRFHLSLEFLTIARVIEDAPELFANGTSGKFDSEFSAEALV